MKIKIIQTVEVPMSPFCKNCYRKETDKKGRTLCTLFNRFIWKANGDYLKCRDCYDALYKHFEKEIKYE